MEAAQDLSISLGELQTENVPTAAAHLPHILGRGRAALKELESECGVAIDMRPAPRPTREEREANEGGGSGWRGERGAGPSGARPMVALVMGPGHGVAEVRERLFRAAAFGSGMASGEEDSDEGEGEVVCSHIDLQYTCTGATCHVHRILPTIAMEDER